jgi:hypothetical protein
MFYKTYREHCLGWSGNVAVTHLMLVLQLGMLSGCVGHRRAPLPTPSVSATPEDELDCYTCLQQLLAVPVLDSMSHEPAKRNTDNFGGAGLRIPTPLDIASDAPSYWLHVDTKAEIVFVTRSGGIGDNLNASFGPWPINEPMVTQLIERVRQHSSAQGQPTSQ